MSANAVEISTCTSVSIDGSHMPISPIVNSADDEKHRQPDTSQSASTPSR